MSTRTRTRQESSVILYRTDMRRMRYLISVTPYLLGPWSAWSNYRVRSLGSGGYETITDVVKNVGGQNAVSHEKMRCSVTPTGTPLTYMSALPQTVGSYQYEWKGDFFLSSNIIASTTHLGTLSGIKALAISKVPAYHKGSFEGYIAIREMSTLTDSMALKAATALARYAANIAGSLDAGVHSKRYAINASIQARRALRGLAQKVKLGDPKEAWQTFLGGLSFASNANMEWKYGWKPMIADMQNVADSAQKIVDFRADLIKGFRVYGHATDVRSAGVYNWTPIDVARLGSAPQVRYAGQRTTVTHAVASIVRSLKPESNYLDLGASTALDAILAINGLHPTGKRLWQLLPTTFISDWFWNAGDVLQSLQTLSAPVSAHIYSHGGMYSEKRVTTCGLTASTEGTGVQSNTCSGEGVKTTYSRAVDSLTGGPVLYVPPITVPTDAGKWFSMAQIAFQRLLSSK